MNKRLLLVFSSLIAFSSLNAKSTMKETLLTTLRNKETKMSEFRAATEKLGYILATKISEYVESKTIKIETPLAPIYGKEIKSDIVLVPVLRSGLTLLNSFMKMFDSAKVGFIGLERDEETAIARTYYYKFPIITKNTKVIVLEPMIATGGSACDSVRILKENGIKENQIIFASVIGATEGLTRIKKEYPEVKIIVSELDFSLNDKFFIVPGLGDFGDRFYGTDEYEKEKLLHTKSPSVEKSEDVE